MDDGTRKMDSVSRRTRSYSKQHFKNIHSEVRRKDQENGDEDDNSIERLSSSEDDDTDVEDLKFAEDDDSVEMLSSGEEEDDIAGDDNGVEYLGKLDDSGLKIRTWSGLKAADDDNVEMLSSGEDEDDVAGDDDNGVEYLGRLDSSGLKIRTGSGLKAADDDNGVEYLGKLDTSSLKIGTESRSGSGLKVDGLDESGDSDSHVSESEPTSEDEEEEEEEELFDEDYKYEESSTSEENLLDAVGTHEKNPRKESGTDQEKDDESDEGWNGDDQGNNVRRNKRRNTEKQRDDATDKKKRKGARRNLKGDDEVEIQHDQVECVGLNSVSKPELGKCSSPSPFESAFPTAENISGQQQLKDKVKLGRRKTYSAKDFIISKVLEEFMNSTKDDQYSIDEDALADDALPLKFRFEDLVVPPPEKSEWEEHIDSLFKELELGLRESKTDCSNNVSKMEHDDDVDESIAAACGRGKHYEIVDEQIGRICKYCATLIMDIKYILPDFHTPARDRRRRMYYYDESPSALLSDLQFEGSAPSTCGSTSCTKGTVWDLIRGVEIGLKPHQREGIEFIWRNIAGDIILEKLKQAVSNDDARGCIIAHGAGTGKTRLTIAFLQTFMKLYPACRPMIMAPPGILLNWKDEFKKWNFNVEFHTLQKTEFTGKANCGALSLNEKRLLKLHSWWRRGGILGISYTMFERLAGETGRRQVDEAIRKALLQRPGLLVLDEGHIVRNDKSKLLKALMNVKTHRRIILTGTPFQNNFKELYNTLRVANPKLANDHHYSRRARKMDSNNKRDAEKLRKMFDSSVHHVQDSTVLEELVPGLRHTLVFLKKTDCQKTLLNLAIEEGKFLRRIRMVSLISVHPSITAVMKRYPNHHSMLQDLKSDVNAGVKTMFLMKLIHFADALGERVLVFSQFLDTLSFIKEQLESNFSWKEGREVLYMDGKLEEKKRQDSIKSFNHDKNEAKVLLASKKACSEGINLTGASRVVLLDTAWNPAVERQAIGRAYRLGQKKVVHVYHLFMSAIDERQYAQQFQKELMSRWIFSLGVGDERKQAGRVTEDKVMEAMLDLDNFSHIFDKIMCQPEESNLIKTFELEEK